MIGLNFGINKARRSRALEKNVTKNSRINSKSKNKYSGLKKKKNLL